MSAPIVLGYGDVEQYYFPNYDNDTRRVLTDLIEWCEDAFILDFSVTNYSQIVCTIILIVHIIILSDKELRLFSINILMIGICVSDILSYLLKTYWYYIFHTSQIRYDTCTPDELPVLGVLFLILSFVSGLYRRVSTWLQVSMVIVRSIVIKFAGNPRFDDLTSASAGWKMIIAITLFSLPLTIVESFRTELWIYYNLDDYYEGCTEEDPRQDNVTFPSYSLAYRDWFYEYNSLPIRIFYFLQASLFEFLPSTLSPICTALLVFQLNVVNRTRNSLLHSDKKDKTNKLVIYMSICFMIVQIPRGIVYTVQIYFVEQPGISILLSYLSVILAYFYVLNASSHCVLCYLLSQQYRNIVKNMIVHPIMQRFWPTNVIQVETSQQNPSESNNITIAN